jgi:hypothetical protein
MGPPDSAQVNVVVRMVNRPALWLENGRELASIPLLLPLADARDAGIVPLDA